MTRRQFAARLRQALVSAVSFMILFVSGVTYAEMSYQAPPRVVYIPNAR